MAKRSAWVAKRGSAVHSGAPIAATRASQSASLKTAMATQRSSPAAGYTPCGAAWGCSSRLPVGKSSVRVERPLAETSSRIGPSRLMPTSTAETSIWVPCPVISRCSTAMRMAAEL